MSAADRSGLTSGLESRLSERTVAMTVAAPRSSGEFVLYWAHHALRAHDNPALDLASHLALKLDLPLLVYQGLGGRHRYNADRHHRFILEAARDFDSELRTRALRLMFHLPSDPRQPGPLPDLFERAACVVSELYPVPPFRHWYSGHARSHPKTPFLLADASCILPMPRSGQAPTRAFQFRKAFAAEQHDRAVAGWPEPPDRPPAFAGDPGFTPFDLAGPLDAAIAACRIDHSLPADADTPGGGRAGYARWNAFLEHGLDDYAKLRNDAAEPQAVSRMSAYLHYGCVSPFRIAREALERGGDSADKFLDELLTWRELAHHFCFRSPELETLEALPDWASRTLREHRPAAPERIFDWETLLRGQTGEPLWDLAQRSLLRRGELHNNVRMSWGKAFLPWAPRPDRALKLMVDLNHRLALDGSDPNSYGGLLWCLGQFDRPFPPGEVFGSVRRRSLTRHAARLDMNRYARQVSMPAGGHRQRVAVVGAGLAGLTAARVLEDQGHDVVVVDKARGAGGRMSTRRDGDLRFDHGAQYFTARDPRFLRHVLAWQERGLVAEWTARIGVVEHGRVEPAPDGTRRYVGVPGMNAVCRDIAAELRDCRFGWRVQELGDGNGGWRLLSTDGDSLEADALVLTVPPEQACALLLHSDARSDVEAALGTRLMDPCWAVMAELDRPLFEDWDAAFVNEGPLAWVCRQASRPDRPGAEAWVLHAGPQWSRDHLEQEAAAVVAALLGAARGLPGAQAAEPVSAQAHRWRFALAREPLDCGALWLGGQRLALAGDWCAGSRVEGAFLSGVAAAGRVMAHQASKA